MINDFSTAIALNITTLSNAEQIASGIRKHWGIENKVHWVLDVAFSEDLSRKRAGNAAQNFSSINRIALNLLKKDNARVGIKSRRKMAGWGNEYLLKLKYYCKSCFTFYR